MPIRWFVDILLPMDRGKVAVALITLFLLLSVAYIYLQFQPGPPPQAKHQPQFPGNRNVYIITASGLNPGHLSSYLYQHGQTPAIDYLAYDGIRCTSAFTTSTDSLAAHLSLLSGMYPGRPAIKQFLDHLLQFKKAAPKKIEALPRLLAVSGYRTAAFLADPDLRFPAFLQELFETVATGDTDSGFFQEGYGLSMLSQIARDWIIQNREHPQFLLLNFNEPAPPWNPPAPYNKQYASHPYDGEIAALDEQIGLFVHLLKETGLFQKSIILFTAPFSRSIEHESSSRYSAEDANFQIPLLLVAPGLLPKHREYNTQVSLVDVFPTIWTLLEKTLPEHIDGLPLFRKGDTREIDRQSIYGEVRGLEFLGVPTSTYQRNSTTRNWTSIPGDSTAKESVLDADPGALLENALILASSSKPAHALDLITSFQDQIAKSASLFHFLAMLALDSGDAKLAIEYLKQAVPMTSAGEFDTVLAKARFAMKEYEPAFKILASYGRKNPLSYYDHSIMCGSLFHLEKQQEALEECRRAKALNPRYADAYRYSGMTYLSLGEIPTAELELKRAIQRDSSNPEGYRQLADLMLRANKDQDAIPYLRKLLDLEPEDHQAMFLLAQAHLHLGNKAECKRLLQKVILFGTDQELVAGARNLMAGL